ncbi:translocation/assembly module TamB domain-containing protein, partial [Kaarinaea lacus]
KTTGVFAFDDYRFSDIVADGKGTATTLNLNSLTATYLEGNWQGNTSLDWSQGFQWQAALTVKDANPAVQWQQLEGRLNGTVTGKGNHQENEWLITGDIKNLSGTFRSYPVSGSSLYKASSKEYAFSDLHLRSGTNSLDGSITISDYLGDTDTQVKSNWKLNAKNLAQLLPDAAGSLVSSGKAFGNLKSPSIDAVASANKYKYQTYTFSKADLKAKANLQRDEKLEVQFNVEGGAISDNTIESFVFNISGTTHSHAMKAKAKLKEIDAIQLRAQGGYRDDQWDGQLAAFEINTSKFGNWKLAEPVALTASDRRMLLRNACLSLETRPSQVCIDLDSDTYNKFDIGTKITKLPIDLFRNLLPERFTAINGVVEGSGQLLIDSSQIKTLDLTLASDGGDLTHTLINDKPTAIHFNKLSVIAKKQKQSIKLSTKMDLQETGQTSAWLTLTNISAISDFKTDPPISGEITSTINDLSLLPLLIPEIQSIEGKVSSQFSISGTLTAPKITGQSKLLAERITLPLVGLELKNTEINTQSTESRKVSIEGVSHSGEGKITIKGEIPDYFAENLLIKLDISGERFLAVKTPDIEMEMSPKISLILEGNTVNMDGEVFVDRAKISPIDTYTVLTPSSDVVFIDPKSKATQQEPYKLLGSLRLKLSEQVYVQTSGFNGRITGELLIKESASDVTLATGELLIKDGRYTASVEGDNIPSLLISIAQKELLIDESKLIFASSPVDNPRLDIRARRPTGTEVIVGVDIKGHANNPQIVLFSEPAMDQADILAYLTLGYPLSEASKNDGQYLARIASSIGLVGGEKLAKSIANEFGIDEVYIQSQDTTQQAQLVLGKYLSPKLYIRYAVGIGEAVDTLQIQYKLTDRWILRTETDETQKGTDLIYTIDK